MFTGIHTDYLYVAVSSITTSLLVVEKTFVTQKIVMGAASIAKGKLDMLELGNLDIERDWGYAPDFVLGMWMMLQQENPSDYVLATGISHKLSEFLEIAFKYFDLDYQKYIHVNKKFFRPNEPKNFAAILPKPKYLGLETINKLYRINS